MKRLFGLVLIMAVLTITVLSCKDDFNEEDFLKLQSELKLKQDSINRARNKALVDSTSKESVESYIASLNEAGDLMAVTIVVREDGAPVEGVTVTFTGGAPEAPSAGRVASTVSATTGADGNAVFDRLPIGRHTIALSKTGYATATAQVNFGTPSAPVAIETSNGNIYKTIYIPPVKKFENLSFPLFSTVGSTAKTAVIKGTVTIENDLTNLTPEIPQNLTLTADFSSLVGTVSPSGSVTVSSYFLNAPELGVATVDNTTGAYSMVLPASAAGISGLKLIIPEIEGNQRLAINAIDDGTGTAKIIPTGPEYRNIFTKWGNNAGGTSSTVIVAGAKAVFNAPAAAGKGFKLNFAAQARRLNTGTINQTTNNYLGGTQDGAYVEDVYKITNRGSGYTSVPTATISGGGGHDAKATASLRAAVRELTVTSTGTGYTGSITINFIRVDASSADQTIGSFSVAAVNGGLPATIDASSFINISNFGVNSPATNLTDVSSFKVTVTGNGTGAAVTAAFSTALDRVVITQAGYDFTSAPAITLSGGGAAAVQGTIQMVDFPVRWNMTPDNSGNTAPYAILPVDIYLNYPATSISNGFNTRYSGADARNHTQGIGTYEGNTDLSNSFAVNGGNIVLLNPGVTLRTSAYWSLPPVVSVIDETPAKAAAYLYVFNAETGEIDIDYFTSTGNGYNTPIQLTVEPSIAGAPGTGAKFEITNSYNTSTGEYTYNGSNRLSAGSGYLPNLNRKAFQTPTNVAGTLPSLQAGKQYIFDIKYGTGNRTVLVE